MGRSRRGGGVLLERSELKSALGTVNRSIQFLLLFILGLFLSLYAILIQRRQLCLTLEGSSTDALPSPYPFQHAAGGITLGGLVFFFFLARQTYRDAQGGNDPQAECLARWNLLASTLVLIASAIRLWTLEQGQGRGASTLIQEENEELPI